MQARAARDAQEEARPIMVFWHARPEHSKIQNYFYVTTQQVGGTKL